MWSRNQIRQKSAIGKQIPLLLKRGQILDPTGMKLWLVVTVWLTNASKFLLSLTHHLWYMASKTCVLLDTLLFYQCFDDVWTTIWWIVQIQCAVFQNKKSFNKERIPTKLSTLHSNFCEVESDYFESHCIVDLEKILVCCHDHAHPPHPLAVAMAAPPVSWTCTSRLCKCCEDLCKNLGMNGAYHQMLSCTGSGDVVERKWGKRGGVLKCCKTSTLELHRVWGGH